MDKILIDDLIKQCIEKSASDLHLNIGVEPIFRIDGKLKKIEGYPVVTPDMILNILEQITIAKQREQFFTEKELDFSYTSGGLGRHRVNVMFQQGSISIALRLLSPVLSPLSSLGLPPIYGEIALILNSF